MKEKNAFSSWTKEDWLNAYEQVERARVQSGINYNKVIEQLEQENQKLKKQLSTLPTKERIIEVLKRWQVVSNATESVLQDYWDCEDDITNEDMLDKIASEILGDDKNEI